MRDPKRDVTGVILDVSEGNAAGEGRDLETPDDEVYSISPGDESDQKGDCSTEDSVPVE